MSESGQPNSRLPIVCNRSVLSPEEDKRRRETLSQLALFVERIVEHDDGFSFYLRDEALAPPLGIEPLRSLLDYERRCCSFMGIELLESSSSGLPVLRLTGPEGTKEVIRAELGVLLGDELVAAAPT